MSSFKLMFKRFWPIWKTDEHFFFVLNTHLLHHKAQCLYTLRKFIPSCATKFGILIMTTLTCNNCITALRSNKSNGVHYTVRTHGHLCCGLLLIITSQRPHCGFLPLPGPHHCNKANIHQTQPGSKKQVLRQRRGLLSSCSVPSSYLLVHCAAWTRLWRLVVCYSAWVSGCISCRTTRSILMMGLKYRAQ